MKFRLKLAGIHLLLSFLIAMLAYGLVFGIWYPAPLGKALGVLHIFLMMLGIDVVLGPLLTLLVAKKGKKTLKMDLAIIGIVQLAALVYGIYNISLNRPAYLTFDSTRFNLVQAKNISKKQLDEATAPYDTLGYGKPNWVAIIPPKNAGEHADRLLMELESGFSPSLQPKLYENLSNQRDTIKEQTKSLQGLADFNEKNTVDAVLAKYPDATGFLPLRVQDGIDMTVLVDDNGQVVDAVDLRPWQ